MDAYKDHPARARVLATPASKSLPDGIGQWCKRIPAEEQADYPVDQNEGGEDDDPAEHARWAARLASMGRNPKAPWKSQTDLLTIDAGKDFISDDGREIWSVLEDRGVEHVLLMGVHLNMCVLGRPFGLRQMAKNGKDVALVRDLTDTMYDPLKPPYVNHFTGTDRVIDHVERFVCPSVTSAQVLGGSPFRYKTDRRPRVAFLIAEDEYRTETTLPPFARTFLGKTSASRFVFDRADEKNDLPGLESALDEADVLVVSARRRAFPEAQVAALKRFVAAGKAVVGIRTASHAFAVRARRPRPRRPRRLAGLRPRGARRPLHEPPQGSARRHGRPRPRRRRVARAGVDVLPAHRQGFALQGPALGRLGDAAPDPVPSQANRTSRSPGRDYSLTSAARGPDLLHLARPHRRLRAAGLHPAPGERDRLDRRALRQG